MSTANPLLNGCAVHGEKEADDGEERYKGYVNCSLSSAKARLRLASLRRTKPPGR